MDLFSLFARLTLDRSGYQGGISEAEDEAQGLAAKLKGGLGTAAKVGAAAIAAVGTAAVAATTAMVQQAGQVAAYGDNIDKASQKLGISAEAYQEWDAVLQHSGTSIDSMGIGMKTLANAAATGKDAFNELGISTERAASMSREDLFAETITALQNVTDENKRAQLAQELFGRSAMELGPLLNTSAADTQAMRDKVHELGGVMSNDAVKAAAAYQDSLQDMQTAFEGVKRNLIGEFLPSITLVMDGLTALFTGGDGIQQIREGVSQFMGHLSEILPQVIDLGADILVALAEAIVDSLPVLVDKAPEIIEKLVSALIRLSPKILEAGVKLVVALAGGLVQAIPEALGAIVQLGAAMFGGIGDIIQKAWNWGADLINNFTEGLKAMLSKPIDAIKGLAGKIKSFLGFSEPEEGPLSNFHTYAPDMMELFAQGITDNRDLITDAIGGAFNLQGQLAANVPGQPFTVPRANPAPRNIVIPLYIDGVEFARTEVPYIEAEQQRVGLKLTPR